MAMRSPSEWFTTPTRANPNLLEFFWGASSATQAYALVQRLGQKFEVEVEPLKDGVVVHEGLNICFPRVRVKLTMKTHYKMKDGGQYNHHVTGYVVWGADRDMEVLLEELQSRKVEMLLQEWRWWRNQWKAARGWLVAGSPRP